MILILKTDWKNEHEEERKKAKARKKEKKDLHGAAETEFGFVIVTELKVVFGPCADFRLGFHGNYPAPVIEQKVQFCGISGAPVIGMIFHGDQLCQNVSFRQSTLAFAEHTIAIHNGSGCNTGLLSQETDIRQIHLEEGGVCIERKRKARIFNHFQPVDQSCVCQPLQRILQPGRASSRFNMRETNL